MQTVELPTGYHYPSEMPKGEYYFDIAAAVKELSENNKKTEIELENGFFLSGTAAERNSQDGLMFDGEALDDNTKELLKISLENTIRTAKIAAKKKFTPKSLQNGDD